MRYPEDSTEYLNDLSGHNAAILQERVDEALMPSDAQIEYEAEMAAQQEAETLLAAMHEAVTSVPSYVSRYAALPARLTGFFAAVAVFARAEMYEAMGDFGLCQHCHQHSCLWCDGCHNRQCWHSTLPSRECVEIMEEA